MLKYLTRPASLSLLLSLLAPVSIPQISQAADVITSPLPASSLESAPTPKTSTPTPTPVLTPTSPSTPALTPSPIPANPSVEQPIRLEISRSKRRVTLYQGDVAVKSYAIAVGKPGWETPLGTWRVRQKLRNPIWIHPFTGEAVKGGDPENPLGRHWIGFWTNGKNWIGFHGTPNPKSVGQAASHGCVRMYNQDVEEIFQKVSLGTPVKVTP
ncbi:L,D-transpeptidase [Trichocoleus sp. FACHB-591]|uniref:L,D-transpeptidase n=1 Tax=Trichocoleus sp. FACHB-591 TaxID=2692872 RepID=UPI0016895CE9|nr:L,D-transpeptidase [Trichocoleus sp. FACHB-591]MBD2098377.1 L,D-transpeptidase [Trichocoleus sp. FACHB-591]